MSTTAEAEAFLQSLANSWVPMDEPAYKRRRSRWGDKQKIFVPGVPTFVPMGLAPEALDALLIRLRIEEITFRLTSNSLDVDTSENRSPSPEPIYNNQGVRINTREQRTREALTRERQKLVNIATRMNPMFKPPADYKAQPTRKSRKIFIPVEKFPEYNFIGLIIGPRGLTQKNMERDSGAKIAIRGKGSVKDGKGRSDGKFNTGEDEPLHVLITAETEESVNKAADMVEALLVPIPEEQNEHKKNQLRKLAEINGTLRDHLNFSFEKNSYDANVCCSICGEASHPTQDCPMKGRQVSKQKLDEEYESFLAEIGSSSSGGGSAPPPWAAGGGSAPPPRGPPPSYGGGGAPPPWAAAAAPPPPSGGYPGGYPGMPPAGAVPWGAPNPMMGGPPHPHHPGMPGGPPPAVYSDEYNDFMKAISQL